MMSGGDIPVRAVKFLDVEVADERVADLKPDTPAETKNTTIDQYIEAAVNFARKPDCGAWCWASEYKVALSKLSSLAVATRIYESGKCAEVDAALDAAFRQARISSDETIIVGIKNGLANYCQNEVSKKYWLLSVEKDQCVTERDDLKAQLAQCKAAPPAKGAKKAKKAQNTEPKSEPESEPTPPVDHLECRNKMCVPIDGAGKDECKTQGDCAQSEKVDHLECRDKQCVFIEGAGEKQCAKDSDCAPKPEPKPEPKKSKVTELPEGDF